MIANIVILSGEVGDNPCGFVFELRVYVLTHVVDEYLYQIELDYFMGNLCVLFVADESS